jgi:hypothetical protein
MRGRCTSWATSRSTPGIGCGCGLALPRAICSAGSSGTVKLALDATLRTRLGAAAKLRALSRPTWEVSAALFFAAIRDVVEH